MDDFGIKILLVCVSSAVSGIIGIVVTLIKLRGDWEGKYDRAAKELETRRQHSLERCVLDMEFKKTIGDFLFWVNKGCHECENDIWNGDMQKSYDRLVEVSRKIEELDCKQLADMNVQIK